MNNPYQVGPPVFDDHEFFDRTDEIGAIEREARADGALSIVIRGPRRIGKSSVLLRARTLLGRSGHPSAYVDLKEIEAEHPNPGVGELTRAVLAKIVARMEAPEGGRVHLSLPERYDTVDGFRERVLPQLATMFPRHRAIVFLDEIEVLAFHDENAPSQVLSALNPGPLERGSRRPLTVIAEGRTWSQSTSDSRLLSQLRTGKPSDLGLFSKPIIQQLLKEPVQNIYSYTQSALDEVYDLSAGFPLLATALARAIFERLADRSFAGPVTLEDVRECVPRALTEAAGSLEWARDQITTEEQMLLLALSGFAIRSARPDRYVTVQEAVDTVEVSSHYRFKAMPDSVFLQSLVENFIVEASPDGLAFRIRAPLFQTWVARDSFPAVQARAQIRDPEAEELYNRGLALAANDELLQARDAFLGAVALNPHHVKAALEAAAINARLGKLDETISWIRGLAHERPGNVDVERLLVHLLTTRAAACRDAKDRRGCELALAEIESFDATLHRFPKAERLRIELKVDHWRQLLADTDPAQWRAATEELAAGVAGNAWWWHALASYCGYLLQAVPGDMPFAVGLVREVFPFLVKTAPDLSSSGDPVSDETLAAVVAEARGATDLAAAWRLTLGVLEGALSQEWDPPGQRIPARMLEELLFLPIGDEHRAKIRELADSWLPHRLAATISEDPEDVVPLTRLLARSPESFSRVRSTIEQVALESCEEPAAASRFLRLAPRLYPLLLDADRRLPHEERLRQMNEYAGQLDMVIDGLLAWDAGAGPNLNPDEQDEWRRLLSRLAGADAARLDRLEARIGARRATAPADLVESLVMLHPGSPDREVVQSILGHEYRLGEALPREVEGVPSGALRHYLATRQFGDAEGEERVLVRAYSTSGCNEATRELLHWLWSNEYRALYSLSTRWEGRALPRLIFAHADPRTEQYILVSEYVGPRTLRHELDEGRVAAFSEADRGELWWQLHAVAEAVAGLHRLGYMHRSIKPENILLTPEGVRSRVRFRLTNFEWSVYLNSLAKLHAVGDRVRDYYLPPEVLGLELQNREAGMPDGEGFGVDAYGLGLVFFECLVRQIPREERRPIAGTQGYSGKRHVKWIEERREEIDQAVRDGNLQFEEASLIRSLIDPETRRREADLDRVAQRSRRLAVLHSGLAQRLRTRPLIAFTPLDFNSASCVKHFLEEEIALPPEAQNDPKALARFIEEELKDALVFLSSSPEERPLLLKGRRLAFTAKPFVYNGQEHRRLAYLEVAKKGMTADGEWLTRIGAVSVRPLSQHLQVANVISEGAWWDELFALADEKLDDLGMEERRFLRKLSVTLELDARVWDRSIYRCEIVESGLSANSPEQYVLLREAPENRPLNGRRLPLLEAIEQNVDRQVNEFDLARSADATAAFYREARWRFACFEEGEDEAANALVRLVRPVRKMTPDPPAKGQYRFLRPWSLAASRVVYQRQREVVRDLQTDSFLLRALTSPGTGTHTLAPREIEFFDKRLDSNKQDLVDKILRTRPLFVVQGPPGTGKTTLAREVVLQLLASEPSARILITSQGHEPLNNLLDKTEEAITEELRRRSPRLRKPLSVRLLAAEKQYGDTATRIDRRYLPAEVAGDILEQAAAWRPGPDDVADPQILRAWHRFLNEQKELGLSAILENRLIRGANLVYATANDRHLSTFGQDAFDLVIVEEAARAYPVELLGPMRLARRWLLIGDHRQLPPFGIDDYRAELAAFVDDLRATGGAVMGRRGAEGNIPAYLGYADADDLHQQLEDTTSLFQTLYRQGERARVPVSERLLYQWRMHPIIGRMASDIFYEGRLKTAEPEVLARQRRHKLRAPKGLEGKAVVWIDVPSLDEDELAADQLAPGGGFENAYEIRALQGFFRELDGSRLETAILSPYRGQVRLMQQRFFDTWHHPVTGLLAERVFTVDSFQGRQASLVAVSLVRNNAHRQESSALGFVSNQPRATVMFSRAERLLVVVGCSKHFARFHTATRPNYVTEIYAYISKHGEVLRAHDYLRRDDREAMESFLARKKR